MFISYFGYAKSPYLKKCHNTRRTEVFFPGVFTSDSPSGGVFKKDPNKSFIMPIRKISHITHNKEAEAINGYTDPTTNIPDPNFKFNATRRVGKDYEWDGSPIGESFRYSPLPSLSQIPESPPNSPYMFIKPGQSLMPEGYYSWWGVQFDPKTPKPIDFERYRPGVQITWKILRLRPMVTMNSQES